MRLNKQLLAAASIAAALVSTACTDAVDPTAGMSPDAAASYSKQPGSAATITVTPSSSSIAAGRTVQLNASAVSARGVAFTGATFTWSSSNPAVAKVSATGLVTGVAAGAVTISAKSGSATAGRASVTVTAVATTPPADTTPTPPPTTTPPATTSGKWISGYYVGYQRSQYPETSIDFSNMTHILVGAIQPTSTGGVTTDFYVDNTNGPIMAKNISSRAHAAGRKAILMLGGSGSLANLKSASSSTYRATFVANLVKTMDNLGYDGIDVDWEPLATSDEPQALQLLKDLRAARPSMILTFPINWVGANSSPDMWLGQLAQVVDQVNIMSYEMAGDWGGWTAWHEGALAGESSSHPTSISSSVKVFLAAGVPAAKLGIGLGAYGSCWRGPTAPGQAVGSGVVAGDNTMTYATIMSSYYSASAYHYDATAKEGYLSFASQTGPQGCTMISYEDPQAVADKGAYVKSAGLGGAIVWTINQGHVATAAAGSQDPILSAAYNAIVK